MKRVRRILFIFGFILSAWAGVRPAQAHALLLRTIPAANSILDVAPAQLEFFFSEAVAPRLIKISLIGSDGRNMRLSETTLDPNNATHLIASLPSLTDGVYLVAWQVVSASDGHQSEGSFPFAVGEADVAALRDASSFASGEAATPFAVMLVQGILYLSMAALTGSLFFLFLVWEPSSRALDLPQDTVTASGKSLKILMLAAVFVLGAASILKLLVRTGQARGVLLGWPWQPEFGDVLFGTLGGLLTAFAFGLAIVIEEMLRLNPKQVDRLTALVLSLGVMLTFSLESHAMADAYPVLPVLADWLHFMAVSIWVGGLFAFFLVMQPIRQIEKAQRTKLTALLIPRFTTLALLSVGVLSITGVYASVLRVGSLSALESTAYGKALIVKLVITAIMITLGAINFLYTSPNMRSAAQQSDGNPRLVQRFNYILAGEVFLGVCLLIWVGVFTSLPTAISISQTAYFQKTVKADDLRVDLSIDPGQPGLNTFIVKLSSRGKPVTEAQDVSLEFISLTGMMPASKAAMTNLGGGEYRLQGGYLAMADQWDIKVVVIREGKFDTYADFKLNWGGEN